MLNAAIVQNESSGNEGDVHPECEIDARKTEGKEYADLD